MTSPNCQLPTTTTAICQIVKRLNDECRLKAIKEKAEAKGAKDARRASELNRRQAESGALVEALSVIRTLVDGTGTWNGTWKDAEERSKKLRDEAHCPGTGTGTAKEWYWYWY